MRNFLLTTAIILIMALINASFADGLETFANFPETGNSYQDGTFEGLDGSTWEYWQCRGDMIIDVETPCLGKDRTPTSEVTSGTISGGFGTINFDYMQAFSTDVDLNVYVNDILIGNVTSSGEQGIVKNSGDIAVDIDGDVFITFIQNNTGSGQVSIDNFAYTSFGGGNPDPEPSNYPTDFTAITAGLSVNLEWTDAIGTQLPSAYIIMAGINSSLPVPVDGTPIPNDTDLSDGSGAFNVPYGEELTTFDDLEGNTTYYFSIYPYTNNGSNIDFKTDGLAPSTQATTLNIIVLNSEDFEDGTLGTWWQYSVASDNDWENYLYGENMFARVTGFEANEPSDDWLISPSLNLDEYENEILNFESAKNWDDIIVGLEIKISEDYVGSGDPYSANWTVLSATLSPGNYTWTHSGDVDISLYNGSSVYIAFHYMSTGTASGECVTWEVDDIAISGEDGTVNPEPTNYPTNFSADESGSSILLSWTDAIGDQLPDKYIVFAGTSSSLPTPSDGVPIPNDSDLSDGSGALNVSYGLEEAMFADLVAGTTYYFSIYPYTNSGVNIDYKNDGTAPTDNAAIQLIPEPTNYPTDFLAEATGMTIDLSWIDAIGAQLPEKYIIFAADNSTLPVPEDGTPVLDDSNLSDGSGVLNINFGIEEATFANLVPETTYYFTIYPYTNSGASIDYKNDGTAPSAEATVEEPVIVVIESENFDEGWGNWTTVSVNGDLEWDRNNEYGIGDTPCALATGYENQVYYENDDWLISPPLNLDSYENEQLVFQNSSAYTGPDLFLKISTNYNGGDPYSATWTTETYATSSGFFEWIESGIIDLSVYDGDAVYVAFHFISTNSESATWQIDDIIITGDEDVSTDDQAYQNNEFKVYPNPSNGVIYFESNTIEHYEVSVYNVFGELVYSQTVISSYQQISLEDKSEGMYIVKFYNPETGTTYSNKILLTK